jgi:hypothetical protein
MYPIPYRFLQDQQKYPKYSWIELNLIRKTDDFRPESYSPKLGVDEPIKVFEQIGTANEWMARKSYVLKEVFTSLNMVKQKYLEEFADKDLHLFVGTTLKFHAISAPNPFVIIGLFYPPKTDQLSLL